jgi:hypothetical protein
MSLEPFLEQLERLRSGLVAGPSSRMRLRYARSWGMENSIIEMAMARPANSSLKVSLYPAAATESTRPLWDFFVDPLVNIEGIEQRSECTVIGALSPGGAVLVRVGDLELVSVTPLRMPIRAKKFGRD